MLAHIPSFRRNPRGALDFLVYPAPKAGPWRRPSTWVARCLGVAHSASSPKAAHAFGCSFTPGLRVTFGGVTCIALSALVP